MTTDSEAIKRVGLIGGTGFVGSYLVDELLRNDMQPVLLVRPGSEHRVEQAEHCIVVSGTVDDSDAVQSVAAQSDAMIYNIGILREFPKRGITFEKLQYEGARRCIDAAVEHGVRRFLLMSANGIKADGTSYQSTKHQAESYLQGLDLEWTIFRPSVLFGEPRGRMEFASQLSADIIESALPAPLFYPGLLPLKAGQFEMSPVHVSDVAAAFVKALREPQTIGQILHLGGPENVSWKDILKRLAAAKNRKKLMLPAPALGVMAAAAMLEGFEDFPITRDQIRMLLEGNTCGPDDLRSLGIEPKTFSSENLAYLNAQS